MKLDLRLIDRITGVGIEHLISGVHQGQKELADGGFAARLDGDVFHAVVNTPGCTHVSGQCLPQLRHAGVGTITRFAVAHGSDGGLHNIGRC